MKNVLHLLGSFELGGSERQAVQLVRLLRDDGSVNVHVAAMRREGALLGEMEADGFEDIGEFRISSFRHPDFLKAVFRCARFVREKRIDIVHSHDFYTNIFGAAVSLATKVKLNIASKRETGGLRSPAQKFVEKIAFRRAQKILVNSSAVGRYLADEGIPSEKIYVVHNGLDLARMTPTSADRSEICGALGLPADPSVRFVTLVANLRHRVKNQFLLLRAASTLAKTHADVHFVLAGEGELRAGLESAAAKLGISDKVHFTGRCDRVPDLLSISTVGVLTSFHEGFPNVVLEYMSAGLPVVATDVGGVPEVLTDGHEGFLIRSDDDVALASKLSEVLSDAGLAERLGRTGMAKVVNRFSTGAQLARTLELYEV
jgi:glycosyltransferase involved in cell wall biosynthesis